MKRRLDIDWDQKFGRNGDADDEPPDILMVKADTSSAANSKPAMSAKESDISSMRDDEIVQAIERCRSNIEKLASKLPDKGAKFRAHRKILEDELSRRRQLPPSPSRTVVDGCQKSMRLKGSGVSYCFREETRPSVSGPDSKFASIFSRKMEENADAREGSTFGKELANLGHYDKQKERPNESLSHRQKKKTRSSPRQWPFLSTPKILFNKNEHPSSDGEEKMTASSDHHFHLNKEKYSADLLEKKNPSQAVCLRGSRTKKAQPVVLVDLDEVEMSEKTFEPPEEVPESVKDAKIYYPSREDGESVEICFADMCCLAPQGYLTSPIMNFYIRYLQMHASPLDNAVCDYHCFNTFFYNKLKQELAYKGSDKELSFVKFRKWWKGVDIFKKAYVLIPIHDDLHWSLVIVCIPDKDDESGPIILHLDSLNLHHSRSLFVNIRRFLIKEWKFISPDVAPLDVPIADRIWKHLPRRIEDKIISVPQQKNEYDCGLFVLFFMERFMEDAPERLKKKDLSMFGKQWFRPEQASALRVKIRGVLTSEFEKIQACSSESSSSHDGSV